MSAEVVDALHNFPLSDLQLWVYPISFTYVHLCPQNTKFINVPLWA